MKLVAVPGVNGLGMTSGVEKSYLKILEGFDYEKVDLNLEDINEQLKQIVLGTKKYFDENGVIFVGGDHSVSYGLVSNFFERFGTEAKLIVFDAHPDLMESMNEPTHEEWLRAIIGKGFKPENILLVGVRRNSENVDSREIGYANEKRIKIIYSDEFDSRRGEVLDFVSSGKVYCSFDVDVFDSSLVGATGYPEENGLGEAQVFVLLAEIKGKIDFWDLVEVNFEKGSEEEGEKTLGVVKRLLALFI